MKTSTKIKLYKSLVKLILFYNCATWALTLTAEERIYSYHGKQLKKINNIRYPKKITNTSFCRICEEKTLSLQIISGCRSLFGHFLRRDKDISTKKPTRAYFIPNAYKLRGRPKSTLPNVFNGDLALIQHPIRQHSSKDLDEITELAQDIKCWRELTTQIEKAVEVSQPKNWNAKEQ